MTRARALVAAAIALAICATAADARAGRGLRPTANPSAVVAAELALARLAQDKGQWTALRKHAAKDAVMFVPAPVNAWAWLKKQADPPQSLKWQPRAVWASCDGSLAVTRGSWQRADGITGTFATVWRRRHDGGYQWLFERSVADTAPVPPRTDGEIATISATVADCPASGPRPAAGALASIDWGAVPGSKGSGQSVDGTLGLAWSDGADGAPRLTVTMLSGGARETVFEQSATEQEPAT